MKTSPETETHRVIEGQLLEYGMKFNDVVVNVSGTTQLVPAQSPIKYANGKRLIVLTNQQWRAQAQQHGNNSAALEATPLSICMPAAAAPCTSTALVCIQC